MLSHKYEIQTAEREEEKPKSPKVYFSHFDLLNSCRMPSQLNMRSLKCKSQTALREEEPWKSRKVYFSPFGFLPDAFSGVHAQP